MNISVIIPVHNGGEIFKQCLESIKQTDPPPAELIVVSDGSTDNSAAIAEEYGARVISLPESKGPARARNIGADTSTGDILFFLDADVKANSDVINIVQEAFSREPELSAIFGSYDDSPAQTNFLSQYKNLFHHYVHQSSSEHAFTFWSGCGAIRRDIFNKMNGFDENYANPSIEDIELGYRMKKAGLNIRLVKSLQIKHLKEWRAFSLVITDLFYRALPWVRLNLRDRIYIKDLNINKTSCTSVVLVFLLLVGLLSSLFSPSFYVVPPVSACILLLINFKFYIFFMKKRGPLFTLCALPWHWLYYFYCGIGMVIGIVQYCFSNISKTPGKTK